LSSTPRQYLLKRKQNPKHEIKAKRNGIENEMQKRKHTYLNGENLRDSEIEEGEKKKFVTISQFVRVILAQGPC
jgi:hypothetical protein